MASAVNLALQSVTQEYRFIETSEEQEGQDTSGSQIYGRDENFNILCKTAKLLTSASSGDVIVL